MSRFANSNALPLREKLAFRFALIIAGLFLVIVACYSIWSINFQESADEEELLSEARLLAQQMDASWSYVNDVQDTINYDADGNYDFKGVYCSIAGKNIANRFTLASDCTVRYVRENPRSEDDEPDEFEQRALDAFEDGETEYYEATEYDGEPTFRYVSALYIEGGCLSCHGEVAGEPDETEFLREGMQIGDLAGAVSLIIPMTQQREKASASVLGSVALFSLLLFVCILVISIMLYHWIIHPLQKMSLSMDRVARRDFSAEPLIGGSGEMGQLAESFNSMSKDLNLSYNHLEDQVRERTADLAHANELLKEESEYKTTFLNTMSHELRTPVASILAYVDMWHRRPGDKNAEDAEVMDAIAASGSSLLTAVNDTLDAARIDADRFELDYTMVDLADLADYMEQTIAPLAAEKQIGFVFSHKDEAPIVRTDPSVLQKILMNLLGNAIKFTEPGGSVEASIVKSPSADEVVITVADTGIGIPEEDLQLVFERFRQSDASISRKYGGSGLGLSLVKDMANLMNGRVELQSEVGKGSTFTVFIPYEEMGKDEGIVD